MAAKDNSDGKNDLEAEVFTAISAFEQILEAMPNDRASLEALSHAYEQIGDHTRSTDYLIRLGNVMIDEGDLAGASDILEAVKRAVDDNPDAQALIDRIESLTSPIDDGLSTVETVDQPESEVAPVVTDSVRATFNMADELSFAWNLMEAGELNQDEYSSVVQDLTEMSASESIATISVLHVLESRGFKNIDRIMGYIANECGTPIVTLSSFDLQLATATLLPMDYMSRCGALVFEKIRDNVMVVVLNPYNKQLQKDIKTLTKKKCHFYMTLPGEFDQALEKVSELIMESEELEE